MFYGKFSNVLQYSKKTFDEPSPSVIKNNFYGSLKNRAKIINGKTIKMVILLSDARKNVTNTILAPLLSA